MIRTVSTRPFDDQKPGTSGLRKKVRVFAQPDYAENFIQSVFDVRDPAGGTTLVIGGDGRFHNRVVIQQAIRIAAANGFIRIIVGRGGLLSTPAASHLVRLHGAAGALILSASHNPGGPDADFGIKYNVANGGPAPEAVTEAIFRRSQGIDEYRLADTPDVDLDSIGECRVEDARVAVVDPVADYADLMETLFDFPAIRAARDRGLTFGFDAMSAITGPYATEIFEKRLGFPSGTVARGVPLEDFGGAHPDPNVHHLADLLGRSRAGLALAAASDGDGDRNLVIGKGGHVVAPSDALAILAANAHRAPGYRGGIAGVARSMPTSRAADRVAAALGVPHYETPTGWKFFGNLLDDGRITLCGEESAGAGSDHVREKDGLWAVLLWLNILADRGNGVGEILADHWATYGRNYYQRHDYEGIDAAAAGRLIEALDETLAPLAGTDLDGRRVEAAGSFAYTDPVDGSVSANQGHQLIFADGSRIVWRLSGTGTQGATLRVYLERFEDPSGDLGGNPADMLAPLAAIAARMSRVIEFTGRAAPDVVT